MPIARFEELQGAAGRLSTPCSSVVRQYYNALRRHDWSELRDILAPEVVAEDRRSDMRQAGPDANVENLQSSPADPNASNVR